MNDPEMALLKGDFHFQLGEYELAVEMYLRSALNAGVLPGCLHPPSAPQPAQTTLKKLISCFESMRCFTYVAVLCQLLQPVDYDTAFRAVGERVTYDAADEIYQFISDPLLLEHTAFCLQKYGFLEKRQVVMDLLQNPILNSANPPAVAQTVADGRTADFFEVLFDQYVCSSWCDYILEQNFVNSLLAMSTDLQIGIYWIKKWAKKSAGNLNVALTPSSTFLWVKTATPCLLSLSSENRGD